MKRKDFGIQLITTESGNFDLLIDVKKDETGKIVSGIALGPTLEQNMACLLIAEPGDFKENLEMGVGLRSALLDEDMLTYRHSIKEQFPKDGLKVKHLSLYNLKDFEIEAEYE